MELCSALTLLWLPAAPTDPADKSLEGMRKFSEQYARRTDTYFCSDLSVTAVVVKVQAASRAGRQADLHAGLTFR